MFFEGFKLDKKSNIGITHLLSNITTKPDSHKGGWTRLLKCQLLNLGYSSVKILDNKDSLNNFDCIIFDLGAEFSGALNMFGGLDSKVYNRLKQLKDFKGQLFSWKHNLPDLTSLESRRDNHSTVEEFKKEPSSFLADVQNVLNTCKVFQHSYQTTSVLIGDSHTPSVWTPEFMIERRDGRTLKGMIEHKTIHRIVNTNFMFNGMEINKVQIHCGSIDIRHHLCREQDSDTSTADLASKLIEQLIQISDAQLITTHTMGIEDESRELPKTGFYKGTPFYGPWEQRNRCRLIFNTIMDGYCAMDGSASVVKLPEYFFDKTDKLNFDVMEKPQSVHLSPAHYKWDLGKNELRWSDKYLQDMNVRRAVMKMVTSIEKDLHEPQ
jgi:hypothetical protein